MQEAYEYKYISTATTTQVKTGTGVLHAIVVSGALAGAVSVIDNTTGSTINIGTLKASAPAGTYTFDVAFTTGLRIITAGADAITVVYR